MPSSVLYTPVLRSSHLERLAPLPGLRVLARDRHPDCDDALLRAGALPVRFGTTEELQADLRADPPALLEVTEPLWLAEWPAALALADAAPQALLVTYAIEVLPHPAPADWQRLAAVAFGTAAAARAYDASCPGAAWTSEVFEERRERCATCFPTPHAVGPDASPGQVAAEPELVFAAEFSERKGIDLLLSAWDQAAPAGWRLRLLGWGPRTAVVQDWASGRADVDVVVRASREQVHDALRRADAVVLPSRRTAEWREQVGLSLVEGLAHGCRLLTSDETGLAPGLGEGHVVVPSGSSAALADGLQALGPARRGKELPPDGTDSRQQVQRWFASLAQERA